MRRVSYRSCMHCSHGVLKEVGEGIFVGKNAYVYNTSYDRQEISTSNSHLSLFPFLKLQNSIPLIKHLLPNSKKYRLS